MLFCPRTAHTIHMNCDPWYVERLPLNPELNPAVVTGPALAPHSTSLSLLFSADFLVDSRAVLLPTRVVKVLVPLDELTERLEVLDILGVLLTALNILQPNKGSLHLTSTTIVL